jgi:hypothetical protein
MGMLTINSENFTPDKESIEAQKQWEQDGTVTDKYIKHVLGDISKGISAFPPEIKQKKKNNKNKPHTS